MNDIIVLLASHRSYGTSYKIKKLLMKEYLITDIISFSNVRIESCVQCFRCKDTGDCNYFKDDDFNSILEKVKKYKILLIISPLYAGIPSKLTAFLERMTSVKFFTEQEGKPIFLEDKKVGVICYDSAGQNDQLEKAILNVLVPILSGYSSKKQIDIIKAPSYDHENKCKDIIQYIKDYFDANLSFIVDKT